MSTAKAVALTLGGLVFLAGGVLMLLDGETVTGIGVAAFGAMAVLVGPTMRPPRRPEEPLEVGSRSRRDRTWHGLVIPFSSRRAIVGVLAGALFTVTGVAFLLDGAVLLGAAVAGFFGAMTLLGVLNVRRGAGALVLTPEELAHVAPAGGASVRWDAITTIDRYDIRGTPILRVDGDVEHHGGLGELLALLTRRHALEIGLSAVGVHPDRLEELVRRCAEDPAERERVARGDGAHARLTA